MRPRRRSMRPSRTGAGKRGRTSAVQCRGGRRPGYRAARSAPYSGARGDRARLDLARPRVAGELVRAVDRPPTSHVARSALAAAVPFLFLHERFQPEYGLELGSTTRRPPALGLRRYSCSCCAAIVSPLRHGIERLRPGRARSGSPAPLLLALARLPGAAARLAGRRALRRPPRHLPQARRVRAARARGAAARPARGGPDDRPRWARALERASRRRRRRPVRRAGRLRRRERRLATAVLPRPPRPGRALGARR